MSAPLPAPRSPLCAEAGSSLPSSLRAAHCVRPSVLPRRRVLRRRRGAAGPGPQSITVPARGSAAVRQCGRSVPGPRNPGAVPRCSACARRRGRGGQPPGTREVHGDGRTNSPSSWECWGEGRGGQNHTGAWHIPRAPAWQGAWQTRPTRRWDTVCIRVQPPGCPAPASPGPSELGLEPP